MVILVYVFSLLAVSYSLECDDKCQSDLESCVSRCNGDSECIRECVRENDTCNSICQVCGLTGFLQKRHFRLFYTQTRLSAHT